MCSVFVEKPDTETAKVYLESGEYFWNSGMFIWRPSVILREIAATLPDLSQKLDQNRRLLGAHPTGMTRRQNSMPQLPRSLLTTAC